MKPIKHPGSGSYHAYASGDGAVRFVHADIHGNATAEKVPLEIVQRLAPRPDFAIFEEAPAVYKAYPKPKLMKE